MRCQILRPFHLLGLTLLLVAGVIAGPPPITITDSGVYATILDDAGVPSFVRVTDVTDLRTDGDSPPIVPDGPEEPDPPTELVPPPEGISADVAGWASDAGDSVGAHKYALIFETVHDGVLDDLVASDDVFRVLKESANGIIDQRWKTFRRNLGEYLVDAGQTGKFETKELLADQLELIRYGVVYSTRDSEPITTAEAVEVIAKVNAVITRIREEAKL